jgi:hypothetical protein
MELVPKSGESYKNHNVTLLVMGVNAFASS